MFVTGLTRIMRTAGVEYEVVTGWEKRSLWRAGLSNTIKACMWHDTQSADAAFAGGQDAPTLGYVTSGLGYPLYNVLFGRSGKAYIVAAGSAAHAGKGSGGGMTRDDANREAIAFSFDANQSRYPVTAAQLESAAKVGKAMTNDWGGNLVHMMHGEWNPRDRHDPTRIPGGWSALKAAIERGSWSDVAPSSTGTRSHTVTAGETLSAIADRYSVSVDTLVTANKLANPNLLQVGQKLTIPGGKAAKSPASAPAAPKPNTPAGSYADRTSWPERPIQQRINDQLWEDNAYESTKFALVEALRRAGYGTDSTTSWGRLQQISRWLRGRHELRGPETQVEIWKRFQTFLKSVNRYAGAIDGIPGPQTTRGIFGWLNDIRSAYL
ncbi:LysM peptidoglycan-binding domain-containing protein [Nesterenkonia jeotgali]|uniref:LysM domain-containing protein n=1 Tax=Nesterenkonia jeotgali TaxID=317018 RepID=A0A0W8ICS7_9MICC|nr:LysM peptidoglycan-binding domain-containing protein [Nesterenkonia jeotgali]KUG57764.1 hypothetical protein AVL63_04375 [Nesterenkonia jeotgali]